MTSPTARAFRASTPLCLGLLLLGNARGIADHEVINLGQRRELFVDRYLIDKTERVSLQLETPRDEGVVFAFDKPWEGLFCGYATIIKDGPIYRLYYRGIPTAGKDGREEEVTCYAESPDGIRWKRPDLGLFKVYGTAKNNVILAGMPPLSHNFAPMLDARRDAPKHQRYKALAGTAQSGLVAFVSEDGVRWSKLRNEAVIDKGPFTWAFDSQNVAFWSEYEGCYLCYFRVGVNGVRRIARTSSPDFVKWSKPVLMGYGEKPIEHLYTNQTTPYYRAPHIYLSIAARFMPGRQVISPEQAAAIKVDPGYFKDCSDGIFMTTRGGDVYDRTFMEGFLRPGLGLENWVSRTNYPARGVVPTGDGQISFYANLNYGQPTSHLRRYSLRTDGFAAVVAPYAGGEFTTKPITFSGKRLSLNFATSAAGAVRVEILDAHTNRPIPGVTLADAVETIGNELNREVLWNQGADVSKIAGRTVRLRFVMKDARLYSLRFRP